MCFTFLKPKVDVEKIVPTSTRRISSAALYGLLEGKFPSVPLYLSDNTYLLCTYDDIALFLAQDQTNKMEYKDGYDCDDFAYRLMGQFSVPGWSDLCFGIVWTRTHALNCMVTKDFDFYYIEPQTDELYEVSDETLRFIMI